MKKRITIILLLGFIGIIYSQNIFCANNQAYILSIESPLGKWEEAPEFDFVGGVYKYKGTAVLVSNDPWLIKIALRKEAETLVWSPNPLPSHQWKVDAAPVNSTGCKNLTRTGDDFDYADTEALVSYYHESAI